MVAVLIPGLLPARWREKFVQTRYFNFNLPDRQVSTGYGALWPEQGRDPVYFTDLAARTGFTVVELRQQERWFFMELSL